MSIKVKIVGGVLLILVCTVVTSALWPSYDDSENRMGATESKTDDISDLISPQAEVKLGEPLEQPLENKHKKPISKQDFTKKWQAFQTLSKEFHTKNNVAQLMKSGELQNQIVRYFGPPSGVKKGEKKTTLYYHIGDYTLVPDKDVGFPAGGDDPGIRSHIETFNWSKTSYSGGRIICFPEEKSMYLDPESAPRHKKVEDF